MAFFRASGPIFGISVIKQNNEQTQGILVCWQCVRGIARRISTRYSVSQFPGQCGIYVVVELLYSKEGPVMHKFQSTEAIHTHTPAAASQF